MADLSPAKKGGKSHPFADQTGFGRFDRGGDRTPEKSKHEISGLVACHDQSAN
jgi:hypothetical protein